MSFLPSGVGGSGGGGGDEVAQLFTSPASDGPAAQSGGFVAISPSASLGAPPPPGYAPPPNTLDEPVVETILRDLRRISSNLVLVVFPLQDRSRQSAALRNWDLWGPMIFTIALAAALSAGSAALPGIFSLVFALVSLGAVILTVNVLVLGGSIGFFQSLCLLGYCIFPLDVVALVCCFVTNSIVRFTVVPIGIAWASWASVPFVAGAVPGNRRTLAVYPLALLYTTLGWLALIS